MRATACRDAAGSGAGRSRGAAEAAGDADKAAPASPPKRRSRSERPPGRDAHVPGRGGVPCEGSPGSAGRAKRRARSISDAEHARLLEAAVHVERTGHRGSDPPGDQLHKHTLRKLVRVPVEEEVVVPVVKQKIQTVVERKVVKGTRMVPVKRYRDVVETVYEDREEIVHSFRDRWVKVDEPVYEVYKTALARDNCRKVPYLDYVARPWAKQVDVASDVLLEKRGHRVDREGGLNVLEVQEEHLYGQKATPAGPGDMRASHVGDERLGLLERGRSCWEAEPRRGCQGPGSRRVSGGGGAQSR